MKAFILKLAFVFAAIVGTTVFTMRVTRADQQGDSQWCHVCESLLASGSIIEWALIPNRPKVKNPNAPAVKREAEEDWEK
jgi:hypothetical protein